MKTRNAVSSQNGSAILMLSARPRQSLAVGMKTASTVFTGGNVTDESEVYCIGTHFDRRVIENNVVKMAYPFFW